MYVHKKVHLGFKKKLSKMFQKYSKLCLPGQYGKVRTEVRKGCETKSRIPPHCRLLPQRDLPVILISGCITCRRILNSKIIKR